MPDAGKKKIGRPMRPSDGSRRREPISFRTSFDLRKKLEIECLLSGRSLSQEAEYRLELSFILIDAIARAENVRPLLAEAAQ